MPYRKEKTMKKLLCLALALLMCAALFTSCGKFDMENADLSQYVDLADISEFSYAEMCEAYEAYRETLSENVVSCKSPSTPPKTEKAENKNLRGGKMEWKHFTLEREHRADREDK